MSGRKERAKRQAAALSGRRMYVFPGSYRDLDLLRMDLVQQLRGRGRMTGFRLSLIAPEKAVPTLWRLWQEQLAVDREVERQV